jgi:hypothetical protein
MEYDNHSLSLPIQCAPIDFIHIIDVTTNNDVYEIMPVIINLLGRSLMIKTNHFNLLVHSVIVWLIQHCVCSCWQVGQDVVQALQQAMNRQHGPKLRVVALVNKISIS